jgi:hypothetical protein
MKWEFSDGHCRRDAAPAKAALDYAGYLVPRLNKGE